LPAKDGLESANDAGAVFNNASESHSEFENYCKSAKRCFHFGERNTMEKLLTVCEVTDLCRISYSTLYRWLSAGKFPAPVNGRGNKLLWNPSQIEDWANYRQSQSATGTTVTSPVKRKQQEKDYRERQAAAERSLERHRTGTK